MSESNLSAAAIEAPLGVLETALREAARIVGPDNVLVRQENGPSLLGPNASMFRARRVSGVIRPGHAEQARQVVTAFSRLGAGPLHPISTGRNWGLGSREPAQDDVVVLDLSRMAAVREINAAGGWAVIEPGVTQGQLAGLLAGTERMLNVTVSAAATSVIGNALDRGVGLRHQRVNDLAGLEVVLPEGDLVRVGWWPRPDRPTAVYPHGLGPSLLPLFLQSSLGVVTAASIRLLPRPEAMRVVRLASATGIRAAATLHILGPDVIDCVVAMRFDRDATAAVRAHRALDLLYECFSAAGFDPYRLDIEHADWRSRLQIDPGATALARRLKAAIDPAGTIARGRYY
jgi:FAD binding domain